MTVPADFLDRLAAIVGSRNLLTDEADVAPYLAEERGLYRGQARAVVRPANTQEVAGVVRLCAAHGVPIVPQGGNTGLVGGGIPDPAGAAVLLSLRRMNRIHHVDPLDFTLTAEAGCVLQAVQEAASLEGCLFPLSLAAEGSAQVGGLIATNAGGVAVLRFGNMRDLVLGLEVVMPDGQVWNGLRALRKDNTGYDLKQLFVGSEGTLGIVTAAVLKLFPKPVDQQTALVALSDVDGVLDLLARARAASGDAVTAFELIPRIGVEMVLRHTPGLHDPFDEPHAQYVLVELSSSRPDGNLRDTLEGFLAQAIEDGLAEDAVIAETLEQRKGLWRIRESIPPAQKHEGGSIKHDVSVPVTAVPAFLKAAEEAVEGWIPGVRVVAFGHVGDGNIHFNLSQPLGADRQAFLDRWTEINRLVHDLVASFSGSISAEHGIGQLKRDELVRTKSRIELDMMRAIKQALDPQGIMNPGKILS